MTRPNAWNPWAALRGRPDPILLMGDLPDPGGVAVDIDGTCAVALDRRLNQTERNTVLAHELIHLERGIPEGTTDPRPEWQTVVGREERRVDDEVARRLVPPKALVCWCFERLEVGETTEPHHVAEHFGVTEDVALRALLLLDPTERAHDG